MLGNRKWWRVRRVKEKVNWSRVNFSKLEKGNWSFQRTKETNLPKRLGSTKTSYNLVLLSFPNAEYPVMSSPFTLNKETWWIRSVGKHDSGFYSVTFYQRPYPHPTYAPLFTVNYLEFDCQDSKFISMVMVLSSEIKNDLRI